MMREVSSSLNPASPTGGSTVDAGLIQLTRRLEPRERILLPLHITREVRGVITDLLREHSPDATDEELRCRLAAVLYGRELAGKAYGWDPGEPRL
jgi:hypothetical protein